MKRETSKHVINDVAVRGEVLADLCNGALLTSYSNTSTGLIPTDNSEGQCPARSTQYTEEGSNK